MAVVLSQRSDVVNPARSLSFCMLKFFNKHNVRQNSPANINSNKLLATFTSGAGRLSKRRSKGRSVNPALQRPVKDWHR